MAKAAKKNQTSNGGSSARKGKNGNGGNGKAAAEKEKKPKPASNPDVAAEESTETPADKKRRGRAPTEGEPLKRLTTTSWHSSRKSAIAE